MKSTPPPISKMKSKKESFLYCIDMFLLLFIYIGLIWGYFLPMKIKHNSWNHICYFRMEWVALLVNWIGSYNKQNPFFQSLMKKLHAIEWECWGTPIQYPTSSIMNWGIGLLQFLKIIIGISRIWYESVMGPAIIQMFKIDLNATAEKKVHKLQ